MNSGMIAVMLGVSLLIGLLGLIAFIWGLRSGQFDDEKKFTQGLLMDSVDELNDAYRNELKRNSAKYTKNAESSADSANFSPKSH
ncbi:cbb3-type cytochrome oxidase assembly protein CcoS [Helicobacter sp. 23-1044]